MWCIHPKGLSRIVPKKNKQKNLQTLNPVLTRWKRREVVRLELQAETLHSAYTCSSMPGFTSPLLIYTYLFCENVHA